MGSWGGDQAGATWSGFCCFDDDNDDDDADDFVEDEEDLNHLAKRLEERADTSGSSSGVGTDPSEEDERESAVEGSVTV